MYLLPLITLIPAIGALIVLALPSKSAKMIKGVSLAISFLPLILTIILAAGFKIGLAQMQYRVSIPWIPAIKARFIMGVDGISLPMVFLTVLLSSIAIIASFNINKRVKGYFSLLLLLETGLIGVFVALDFVLFYVFWELVLLPMYFLIGIWGSDRREYAAIKFFLYTLVGSVLMLVGILTLFFTAQPHTFDILALATKQGFPRTLQLFVFAAFFVGFAIKVPMFPFHTWLPDAHVEAPTAVSVLLAGVLLKMGSYGFIRIAMPILPEASKIVAAPLAILAVISIVYGAFCAMAQKDLKKMVAYSSVSHMGFVMLGIATLSPVGVSAAVLQMFNHGTITGMLFLLVGLIYERTHTRQIADLGALSKQVPILGGILCFAGFASLGLPGLSGFWGEFLVLLSTVLKSSSFFTYLTVISTLGIVITATYILRMIQGVCFGEHSKYDIPDVTAADLTTLVPLMAFIILIGVWPTFILNMIEVPVKVIFGAF